MKTIVLMFVLASLIACNSNEEPTPVPVIDPVEEPDTIPDPGWISRADIELSAGEQQLPEANNTFAFNLLKTVYANENQDKNILLSPLSANLALAMLNNGAAGNTQHEIQQALGYAGTSPETINTYAQKIIGAMQTLDPRGVFESANSIWAQNGLPVLDAFKNTNRQYYQAEVQSVDFTQPTTLPLINGWASEKTHGKIPKLLDEINPQTVMMLLNALYFKGYWTVPFNKDLTANAPFYASNGSEQTVPTMRKTELLPYAKLTNSAAVELSFGNRAFSLVVVLPDKGTSLAALIEQIDAGWWTNTIRSMGAYEVEMTIPRFEMEYSRTLNDDFAALGMQEMFNPDVANFTGISLEPLFVSKVLQKTFASMNEEGMEAAAVTAIGMVGSSGMEYERAEMKVNRPFLYFIKEQSTGLVFFTGIMNKI